jgi:mandelate racemase
LKLRLGRERLADDVAAIQAVRDAVGEDVKLMVDFNQGLSLGDALHWCHALDAQGLYWFEEPIAYDNLAGYAQLTRELKTPVQLGENFYGPRPLFDAIQAKAGDYVMPDLMRIGGVTGWLRAAAIAGAAGVEMSTHLYPEVAAHLMRVTETRTLARMAGLGQSNSRRTVPAGGWSPPHPGPAGQRHQVG